MNFETGFPILWFIGKDGDTMQYKGPKDANSLVYFLKSKTGNGLAAKKVRFLISILPPYLYQTNARYKIYENLLSIFELLIEYT